MRLPAYFMGRRIWPVQVEVDATNKRPCGRMGSPGQGKTGPFPVGATEQKPAPLDANWTDVL